MGQWNHPLKSERSYRLLGRIDHINYMNHLNQHTGFLEASSFSLAAADTFWQFNPHTYMVSIKIIAFYDPFKKSLEDGDLEQGSRVTFTCDGTELGREKVKEKVGYRDAPAS